MALCGRLPATHLFLGTPARLRTWILTAMAIKSVNPRMLKSKRAMTVQHHTMWIRAGQHKMLCSMRWRTYELIAGPCANSSGNVQHDGPGVHLAPIVCCQQHREPSK